jgi:hypothetical protein
MIVPEILHHTLQVTAFVAVMMIAVEYLNVLTRGAWPETLATSRWKQYLVAVALGSMPGCLGAFAVVALYTHRMISFGALVACMVATTGDEAFVMLAMFPREALLLSVALAMVGLLAGMVTDRLIAKGPSDSAASHPLALHDEGSCRCFRLDVIHDQLRHPSPARGVLSVAIGLFVLALVAGQLGPEPWNWLKWTLLLAGSFALFIVLTVPEHFLEEHLWRHVMLQHVPRIFAWTGGALVVVTLLERFDPGASAISDNRWAVLVVASLLGIVPESGPHLLIVSLYSEGVLPVSTLVASSIVQDGHGMLPLLAFSRVEFTQVKGINLVVGLLLGAILMLIGW